MRHKGSISIRLKLALQEKLSLTRWGNPSTKRRTRRSSMIDLPVPIRSQNLSGRAHPLWRIWSCQHENWRPLIGWTIESRRSTNRVPCLGTGLKLAAIAPTHCWTVSLISRMPAIRSASGCTRQQGITRRRKWPGETSTKCCTCGRLSALRRRIQSKRLKERSKSRHPWLLAPRNLKLSKVLSRTHQINLRMSQLRVLSQFKWKKIKVRAILDHCWQTSWTKRNHITVKYQILPIGIVDSWETRAIRIYSLPTCWLHNNLP